MPEWVDSAISIAAGLAFLLFRKPITRQNMEFNRRVRFPRPYRGQEAVVEALITSIAVGFILSGIAPLIGWPSPGWVLAITGVLIAILMSVAYLRNRPEGGSN